MFKKKVNVFYGKQSSVRNQKEQLKQFFSSGLPVPTHTVDRTCAHKHAHSSTSHRSHDVTWRKSYREGSARSGLMLNVKSMIWCFEGFVQKWSSNGPFRTDASHRQDVSAVHAASTRGGRMVGCCSGVGVGMAGWKKLKRMRKGEMKDVADCFITAPLSFIVSC